MLLCSALWSLDGLCVLQGSSHTITHKGDVLLPHCRGRRGPVPCDMDAGGLPDGVSVPEQVE